MEAVINAVKTAKDPGAEVIKIYGELIGKPPYGIIRRAVKNYGGEAVLRAILEYKGSNLTIQGLLFRSKEYHAVIKELEAMRQRTIRLTLERLENE